MPYLISNPSIVDELFPAEGLVLVNQFAELGLATYQRVDRQLHHAIVPETDPRASPLPAFYRLELNSSQRQWFFPI